MKTIRTIGVTVVITSVVMAFVLDKTLRNEYSKSQQYSSNILTNVTLVASRQGITSSDVLGIVDDYSISYPRVGVQQCGETYYGWPKFTVASKDGRTAYLKKDKNTGSLVVNREMFLIKCDSISKSKRIRNIIQPEGSTTTDDAHVSSLVMRQLIRRISGVKFVDSIHERPLPVKWSVTGVTTNSYNDVDVHVSVYWMYEANMYKDYTN